MAERTNEPLGHDPAVAENQPETTATAVQCHFHLVYDPLPVPQLGHRSQAPRTETEKSPTDRPRWGEQRCCTSELQGHSVGGRGSHLLKHPLQILKPLLQIYQLRLGLGKRPLELVDPLVLLLKLSEQLRFHDETASLLDSPRFRRGGLNKQQSRAI